MNEERRQVPRYLAEIPGVLSRPGEEAPSDVTVVVLGVRGCCIKRAGGLTIGGKCRLSFSWQGREIHTEAEVAWKGPEGLAGLRFLSLDEHSVETLRTLLATLRLQPLIPQRTDD
jgi:hypothetical protein